MGHPAEGKVLVVPCSLRAASANRGLARAAAEHLGERAELYLIDDLPLFSEDHEQDGAEPTEPHGRALREAVRAAGSMLICTPEYDAYPPAMAINLLNWLSREPDAPLKGKPVAIAGAAAGFRGARRGQAHLRMQLETIGTRLIEEHFYLQIADRFDTAGDLVDADASRRFVEFLDAAFPAADA